MKRIREWSYPVGLIALWVVASVFTISSLSRMNASWEAVRNPASVSVPRT
jgi:hypothetical protein